MINSNQAMLIYNNNPDMFISKYIREKDFFITLLTHLQEHFSKYQCRFEFSIPYFNELGYTSDSSYIDIDGTEFGQLFFLTDKLTKEYTLFLYSERLNVKYYLLLDDYYDSIQFDKYAFFLESIHGFYISSLTDVED